MSARARHHGATWSFLLVVAFTLLASRVALAENGVVREAPVCPASPFANGTVASIIDGRTFVLDDGREVRLAAIEAPETEPAAARARERLHSLVNQAAVVLKGQGDRDRYGRLVAQVFLSHASGEPWVQADLVASGHAMVAARASDRACAAALIMHERAARNGRLGLWSDPYYDLRRAEYPAGITADRGRFTIVEGKVLSVRESGSTIYVNFGKRWSEDFTVTIAKRNERTFAASGIEPKTLSGRSIRVRGWIEERGGPWIEATRPEQIELVERN